MQPVACSGSNASSEVALLLVVPSAHAVGAAAGSARAGEAGAASPVCAQTREGLAGRDLFATDEERVAGVDAEARGARWRRLADAMSVAGSVAEIWRYPVKSMGGERLAQSAIAARGLHADRMWAVRDAELDTFTTARRWPVLLQCSARFAENPADRSAGPGDVLDVIVTFPDGSEVSSSDPAIHDRLSELIGKPARLESLPALPGEAALPDTAGHQGRHSPPVHHPRRRATPRCFDVPGAQARRADPLCHPGRGAA